MERPQNFIFQFNKGSVIGIWDVNTWDYIMLSLLLISFNFGRLRLEHNMKPGTYFRSAIPIANSLKSDYNYLLYSWYIISLAFPYLETRLLFNLTPSSFPDLQVFHKSNLVAVDPQLFYGVLEEPSIILRLV